MSYENCTVELVMSVVICNMDIQYPVILQSNLSMHSSGTYLHTPSLPPRHPHPLPPPVPSAPGQSLMGVPVQANSSSCSTIVQVYSSPISMPGNSGMEIHGLGMAPYTQIEVSTSACYDGTLNDLNVLLSWDFLRGQNVTFSFQFVVSKQKVQVKVFTNTLLFVWLIWIYIWSSRKKTVSKKAKNMIWILYL